MPTPTRKIIQIAIVPDSDSIHPAVMALCDDGTIWVKTIITFDGVWVRHEDVPQHVIDLEFHP